MLATLNMPPTTSYKWYCKPQHSTWNNRSQYSNHGWKITSLLFDINNNLGIEPMFCKYFINLQNNDILKNLYCSKKSMVTWQGFHFQSKNAQWEQMCPFLPWTFINKNLGCKNYKTFNDVYMCGCNDLCSSMCVWVQEA
jgi:hypothetical protein